MFYAEDYSLPNDVEARLRSQSKHTYLIVFTGENYFYNDISDFVTRNRGAKGDAEYHRGIYSKWAEESCYTISSSSGLCLRVQVISPASAEILFQGHIFLPVICASGWHFQKTFAFLCLYWGWNFKFLRNTPTRADYIIFLLEFGIATCLTIL